VGRAEFWDTTTSRVAVALRPSGGVPSLPIMSPSSPRSTSSRFPPPPSACCLCSSCCLTTDGTLSRQRHEPPDGVVDGAAAPRGVAVGCWSALRHPRSGCDVRIGSSAYAEADGHRRRADGASLSLAESVRRTRHRLHPTRVPRSHHRVKRALAAPPPFGVTSPTITSGALTSRWTRMRPSRGPPSPQSVAPSSQSHMSAGCITTTNDGLPDRRARPR
jgi:hypothetical protein